MNLSNSKSYQQLLQTILNEIGTYRIKAAKGLNITQMQLYFAIGRAIVQKQEKEGWGKSIVETLATDLKNMMAVKQGFSSQNLWFMRQFFTEYQSNKKLQPLALQVP
jgi:predicted nuclease of restriction endonuclease-like (RecB) superfamily